MNSSTLPPLTPPSSTFGSDPNTQPQPQAQSPVSAGVEPVVQQPSSVPAPASQPSLGMELPQVSEPSIAAFQNTSVEQTPVVAQAPEPGVTQETAPVPELNTPPEPSALPKPGAEADFTPTSPILAGLQDMSSQPFQDPNTAAPASMVPGEPAGASTTVPQESIGEGLNSASQTHQATPAAPAPENTPPSDGGNPKKPGLALPKLPQGKGLLALVGGVLLLVVGIAAAFFFLNRSGTPTGPGNQAPATKTTLTYWGLWEPNEVMEPLIQQYENLNPGVDIVYSQQNRQQYRARMQNAVRAGNGPDIFRYHNTWVPMIKDDLATAPRSVLPASELQQEFYPVMAEELVQNNSVVGVPLMFDGLALLYNESMLEAANALPPRDWREVRELAARLAIRTSNNSSLDRGGIALGTAENVDNSSDILALMMLQNSATPGNPLSPDAQTALEFYTLFSRSDGVWNSTMPQSSVAFANEQVAMILVPSWRIHEIQKLNPNLRFGVTRLPQLSDEQITWASYWVEGVSKTSDNTEEAWKFLAWLSQPEQLRRLHSEAVKYRGFGELYPRVEMASEIDNPLVQPYLEDALYAKSWPLASMTHDEGLNDQLIQYYTDAINQMNRSGNAESALEAVFPGIQQVLSRYGFSVSAARPN